MKLKKLSVEIGLETYVFSLQKSSQRELLEMGVVPGTASALLEIRDKLYMVACDTTRWHTANISYLITMTGGVYIIHDGYDLSDEEALPEYPFGVFMADRGIRYDYTETMKVV